MRTTANAAKAAIHLGVWIVLLVCTGSTAGAQDTKAGFAVGAAVPATGIALHEPALAVSGWLSRPISGSYGWRAEVGGVRLQLPDSTMFGCAAAGFFCAANLDVSFVSGGLHLEPGAEKSIAPYGYATIGLYHLSASAEVQDLREGSTQASHSWSDNAFGVALGSGVRVRLSGRTTLRAELRYSGFSFKPGTVHWASLVTPTLTTSVAF
jgi:hypothetical protein